MVHVVGAKTGAHQLLEQISLFVTALGATKACQGLGSMLIPDLAQAACGAIHRLLPSGLAEIPVDLLGKDDIHGLGRPLAPDEGFGQAVFVMDIVKSIPALDTQATMVGRTIAAIDIEDGSVLDVEGEQTADPTVRTGRLNSLVRFDEADVISRHKRTGRTGLDALAAGHAGADPHGIPEIKNDLGMGAAEGIT